MNESNGRLLRNMIIKFTTIILDVNTRNKYVFIHYSVYELQIKKKAY